MEIKLTNEQMNEIINDGFLRIKTDSEDATGFGVYLEFDKDRCFTYGEVSKDMRTGWCFDDGDLEKMKEKKPFDPYYTGKSKEPLCPNCMTSMIYKFDYCPKCGQRLDWRESV